MALSTFNTFNAWGSIARSSPPTTPGKPVFISASITSLIYSFDQSVGSMPITYSAFLSSVALSGGQSGTGNPTSYTISGLVSNTIYTVGMKATNFVATSNQSPTTDMLTVPSAPTTVSASTGNTNTQGASITFTAPTGNGTITSYTITSTPTAALTYSGTTSPISILSGLTSNTAYTFSITATNNSGTSTSTTAAATTYPDNPTNLVITPRSGDFTFMYAAPTGTITGYNVYINSVIVSSNLTNLTYSVTSLTGDTRYSYKISALNGTRESYGLTGNQATLPSTAPTISATARSSTDASTMVDVTVNYTRNANLTYTYYATSTPGSKSASASATLDATIVTVSGLTPLTSYTFIAYCNNGYGVSPNSTSSSAIITGPPIPIISNVTTTDSTATITFSSPTVGSGGTIFAYTINATKVSGPGGTVSLGSIIGSPATITGLVVTTTYNFQVCSFSTVSGTQLQSNFSTAVSGSPSFSGVTATVITSGLSAIISLSGIYDSTLYTSFTATSSPSVGSGTSSLPTIISPYPKTTKLNTNTSYTFAVTADSKNVLTTNSVTTGAGSVNATGVISGITTAPTHLIAFTAVTTSPYAVQSNLPNNGSVGGTCSAVGNTASIHQDSSTPGNGFLNGLDTYISGRGQVRWDFVNFTVATYITLPNITTTASGATFAFYIYKTNVYAKATILFAGTGTSTLQVYLTTSSNIGVKVANSSGTNSVFTIPGSTWTHVTIVFTNTTSALLYIDGYYKETINTGGTWFVGILTSAGLGINAAGYYFDGGVSDLRIYNYQLTAAQVAAVYCNR